MYKCFYMHPPDIVNFITNGQMKRGKMMNLYADTGPFCPVPLNSLRPRLNRRPFADDIFKCIFLNENEWISPRISLKFVPKVRINNIPSLVQIMAWRRSGGKPLSEPMMVSLLTHICVTRPQWINQTTHLWKRYNQPQPRTFGMFGWSHPKTN